MQRHSEFVDFPIQLWVEKTVSKEITDDEADESDADEADGETTEITDGADDDAPVVEDVDDETAEAGTDTKKKKTKAERRQEKKDKKNAQKGRNLTARLLRAEQKNKTKRPVDVSDVGSDDETMVTSHPSLHVPSYPSPHESSIHAVPCD